MWPRIRRRTSLRGVDGAAVTTTRCILRATNMSDPRFSPLFRQELPDVPFHEERVQLQRGDAIIVYSDGIPDAKNEAGEFFTAARLRQVVTGMDGLGAEALGRLGNTKAVPGLLEEIGRAHV